MAKGRKERAGYKTGCLARLKLRTLNSSLRKGDLILQCAGAPGDQHSGIDAETGYSSRGFKWAVSDGARGANQETPSLSREGDTDLEKQSGDRVTHRRSPENHCSVLCSEPVTSNRVKYKLVATQRTRLKLGREHSYGVSCFISFRGPFPTGPICLSVLFTSNKEMGC